MKCKRCKERGKNWDGQDPVCYLENNGNPFACESLIQVREKLKYNCSTIYNDEEYITTIPITDSYYKDDEVMHLDFVIFAWYKRRGRITMKAVSDETFHDLDSEAFERVTDWILK